MSSLLPDSGDPGDIIGKLNLPERPALLTDATWQHIRSRYQLRGELGQGGQACVFLVKESALPHGKRAIKVYHAGTEQARQHFEHECKALASDHLPGDLVVGYYDCVSEPGLQPYIVLEHIDGETLGKAVARTLSADERIDLWERVLRGLHQLHLSNLVFGDLSPNNVMVQNDGRIRFVDLSGAKHLKKAFSDTSSSANMGTPGVMPDTWNAGETRTSLVTDIYAVSAIGFLILTGESSKSLSPEKRQAALDAKGIPAAVGRIVLRGLLEPQKHKPNDARLYSTAQQIGDDIRTWRAGIVRRRQQRRWAAMTVALMLCVGIIGLIGWQKYWTEATASALRVWHSLDAQIQELPNRSHPAITRRMETIQQLQGIRNTAEAAGDREAARKALADLQTQSRDILRIAREIDLADKQRLAMGKLLLEETATADSGFWVKAAPVIESRLAELATRYTEIGQQIDAGETATLAERLATLQTDLAELFKVNVEARSTFEARLEFDRVRQQVPERLQTEVRFLAIDAAAAQAQQLWNGKTWDGGTLLALARSQFGQATQQLNEWLPTKLTAEEAASLEANNRQRIAELNVERERHLAEIQSKATAIDDLNQQIARLSKERLDDQQKLTQAMTTLTSEQTLRKTAEENAATLAHAEADRKKLQSEATTLNTALQTANQNLAATTNKLTSVEQERDRFRIDADRWKKLAQANPGVRVAISEQLAAIEAELGTLDPKDHEATHAAFVKAVTEYRRIEAERAELLKPDGFEAKHPKVKAKDAELANAETVVRTALAKRDEADGLAWQNLQQQIDARQKLHDDERALGVAEQNSELITLRAGVSQLKTNQVSYAGGHSRQSSTTSLAIADVLKLAPSTPQLVARAAPLLPSGSRDVVLPGNVKLALVSIPAGRFTMGSNAASAGSDETPHEVSITKPFLAGKYEVTIGQTLAWLNAPGVAFDESWLDLNSSYCPVTRNGARFQRRTSTNFATSDDQPMQNISHFGAVAFSDWCSQQNLGLKFRLPTEAEWEYMARAGSTTAYPWGESCNGTEANVDGTNPHGTTNKGPYKRVTTVVGSYPPNAWGLHDTVGNVWEWTGDWYDSGYYGSSPAADPTGPGSGSSRVLRGGSWLSNAIYARSSYRDYDTPDDRHFGNGFRIVAE